jgi:dipeptide/tripeptide permease
MQSTSNTNKQLNFQAPERMQSVMQAAWLLNVAFGNLIVTVVAKAKLIPRQV